MIQLPLMNTPPSSKQVEMAPPVKETGAKGGRDFEGAIKNEEAELEPAAKEAAPQAQAAAKPKTEKGDEETAAQTKEVSQTATSDKEVEEKDELASQESHLSEEESQDAEPLEDIDQISLSEVLSELVLGLNQAAVAVQSDQSAQAVQDKALTEDEAVQEKVSMVEIGLIETLGLDIEQEPQAELSVRAASQVEGNTQNKVARAAQTLERVVESEASETAVRRVGEMFARKADVETEDEKLDLDAWVTSETAVSDEEGGSFVLPEEMTLVQGASNTSNEQKLEDLSPISSVTTDIVDAAAAQVMTDGEPDVVALASKSLLEASTQVNASGGKSVSDLKAAVQSEAAERTLQAKLSDIVEAKQVIKQVFEVLRGSMRQESQQIQLRLDPPEWGSVQIRLNIVKNDVNITMMTENQAVKEALDKGVQALRGQFMQQGLNLGHVNIGVGGGSQQAEKDAREQLSDAERNQNNKSRVKPAAAAKATTLIRGTDSVIDSHV